MANDQRSAGTVNERRRRLLAGAAGGLTVGALGLGGAGSATAADEDTLTIVHDTHFHGRFEDADDPEKEIARYQTLVDEIPGFGPAAGAAGVAGAAYLYSKYGADDTDGEPTDD